MARGKGRGYLNLIARDPKVHSDSARGVKQGVSGWERQSMLPDDLSILPMTQRKGLIKEIARKAVEGVGWAKEWEKKHFAKQNEWVKTQYEKAKAEAEKIKGKLEDWERAQLEKEKDKADVRDELDTDDDGTQDIPMSELEDVNSNIRTQLDGIDLDGDSFPDYKQPTFKPSARVQPSKEQFQVEGQPERAMLSDVFVPSMQEPQEEYEVIEPEAKDKEFNVISNLLPSIYAGTKQVVKKKVSEQKQFQDYLMSLSDNELFEMGARDPKKYIGEVLTGRTPYEAELIRRIKERDKIERSVAEAKARLNKKNVGGSQISMRERRGNNAEPSGGVSTYFGFINPSIGFKRGN